MAETVTIGGIVLEKRSNTPPEYQYLIPEVTEYEPQGYEATALALAYKNHRNLLMEGPTGCGKNTAIDWFCNLLSIPRVLISMADGTGIDQLIGTMMPEGLPGGGFTVSWRDGALPLAIAAGACFVMDEVNAADERVLMRIHDFLAKGGRLTMYENADVQGRDISPFVNGVHNGMFSVATMNPSESGKYSGTKTLNQATRDRFSTVQMNYLGLVDPKREAATIAKQARCKLGRASRVVKVFNEIRKRSQMTEDDLAKAKLTPLWVEASTRKAIDICTFAHDISIMRAVELAYVNEINPENRPVIHKMFLDEFATDESMADVAA